MADGGPQQTHPGPVQQTPPPAYPDMPLYPSEAYQPIPGQPEPYYQQSPPIAPTIQQNNAVFVTQQNTQPDVIVVKDEKDYARDCGGVDCTCCPDNNCGSCCRQCWLCETGYNWYSPGGKGGGWIILLLLLYLVFGAAIAGVALVAVILCTLGYGIDCED